MKYIFSMIMAIVCCCAVALSQPFPVYAASSLKEQIKGLTTDAMSAFQDIVSGVEEGISQGEQVDLGREEVRSVSGKEELSSLVTVSVLKLEDLGGRSFQVNIAVRNENDFPVRLTGLMNISSVVLLDSEGFSYTLPDPLIQGKDVIVLAKAATRVRYTFSRVEGRPATFRLYNTDFPIP